MQNTKQSTVNPIIFCLVSLYLDNFVVNVLLL